jgi:hypothetical protein
MPTSLQPFAPRSTVSEDLEGLRISIPPKRDASLLFLIFWCCGWTAGGIFAFRSLLHQFHFFIFVWLIGWAVGEASVGYTILYALGGRQIVLANSDTLTCRTQIFGIGLTRSYLVRDMRDLRFQPEQGTGKGRRASRIAFDYGAKTVTFGADIGQGEAAELIARIKQRCAIPETSKPQESAIKFWGRQ